MWKKIKRQEWICLETLLSLKDNFICVQNSLFEDSIAFVEHDSSQRKTTGGTLKKNTINKITTPAFQWTVKPSY